MKKKTITFLFILIGIFSVKICFADNPFVQTLYTADPAPMVHDGVCYVYTTHDEDVIVNNFYTMNNWQCYSTTDMQNWTHHGTVLSYTSFSWGQGDAWAAQCIYRNGKFYLYVPMTRKNAGGARVIGVAVSDSPTGPFTDPIGGPLIANNGARDIDPSVFIDDDGQAYLYWGNGECYYVRLNEDMISYSGGIAAVSPGLSSFVEGPWIYKHSGSYYLVYASMEGGSEAIAYATSNGPTGPWTSRGTIMPPLGSSFTNHPGVAHYMGNSYLFYHSGVLPDGGSYHRSVCVDQFSYNPDGTIPAVSATSQGPSLIGNLNPYVQVEAETICTESGVETETCGEGGMNMSNIENGDWIKVKGADFDGGATSFEARVASANSGGNIEIRLGSSNGTLVGTCSVPGTGGWQSWTTQTCAISGATGVHDLYFRFSGGSGTLFNFNWWKFYGDGSTAPPTPEPTPTLPPQQNPVWSGGPYTLDGTGYADLPDGLTNNLADFSVACRVNLNSLDTWSRIFDFGGNTNVFMMLTPASGTTGYPYFCLTTSGASGEQSINGTSAFPIGSWQHIAVVLNGDTGILYINAQEVGRNTDMTLKPANLGNTLNNYIGRSQWEQDPYLNGEVDDFYIYNRALSAAEVAVLADGGSTGTPGDANGDANGDGTVNIVDALLVARYYVGLEPPGFIEANSDVNCDGLISIVDALFIARYYVGLITGFAC